MYAGVVVVYVYMRVWCVCVSGVCIYVGVVVVCVSGVGVK